MRPKNSVSRHLYFCLLCHFSVDVQCSEEALWIDRLINSESLQTLKDELQEALPRAETTETGTVFVQRILWKLRIVTVSKQKPFVRENCQCFASVKGLSTCSGCHQVSRGEAKKPERWSARREALWQYYGSTMANLPMAKCCISSKRVWSESQLRRNGLPTVPWLGCSGPTRWTNWISWKMSLKIWGKCSVSAWHFSEVYYP